MQQRRYEHCSMLTKNSSRHSCKSRAIVQWDAAAFDLLRHTTHPLRSPCMVKDTEPGDHSRSLSCWTLPMLRCIVDLCSCRKGRSGRRPEFEACTAPSTCIHSLLYRTTLLHAADPH